MAHFTIGMLADQCGVTPANIRSWQRYGLLKPYSDKNGHRFFNHSHIARIETIVRLLYQGIPLDDMLPLIDGNKKIVIPCCSYYQQQLLTQCKYLRPQNLRTFIWRYGRELPPAMFIDHVIRPLRNWLDKEEQPELQMSRVLLDTALIEYAAFLLRSARKRSVPTLFILSFHCTDSLALWLQAIRYAGDGFQVEVMSGAVVEPDLSQIKAEHIMIWSEGTLTERQQQLYESWLAEGYCVFLAGP